MSIARLKLTTLAIGLTYVPTQSSITATAPVSLLGAATESILMLSDVSIVFGPSVLLCTSGTAIVSQTLINVARYMYVAQIVGCQT